MNTEEQRTILQMVRDRKVGISDATRLLVAIGTKDANDAPIQSLLSRLENGEISVEEALGDLNRSRVVESFPGPSLSRGKNLRILVERGEKRPVNIRVPLGWVETGLDLLPTSSIRVDGNPIDKQKFLDALRTNIVGTILEVDSDDGEHVVISIE